ncbi:hypothetical protein Q9L58_010153 [Maublancomyces gigas]|uniref:Uncharacterized protein n=1 Tax=Discina gigas TaxID=1032678 RepID=A0ABR3G5C6_9PEZI
MQKCWPILAAWLADHAEHCNLQNYKTHACLKCQIEPDDIGPLIKNPASKFRRQQEEYSIKLVKYGSMKNQRPEMPKALRLIAEIKRWFHSKGLKPLRKVVYLGMMTHLLDWLTQILTDWGRILKLNAVWKEMPPYPGFVSPTKAYSKVSQWQGKGMRNFVHIVLPALASTLHNRSPPQRLPFQEALRCDGTLIRDYVFAMNIVNIREIASKGHHDRDVVDGLQLNPPSAQQIANQAHHDCENLWVDQNLRALDITEPYFGELAPNLSGAN